MGPPGPPGFQGFNGTRGISGLPGMMGMNGTDGTIGMPGPPGISGTSINVTHANLYANCNASNRNCVDSRVVATMGLSCTTASLPAPVSFILNKNILAIKKCEAKSEAVAIVNGYKRPKTLISGKAKKLKKVITSWPYLLSKFLVAFDLASYYSYIAT